jgi:hypothetical protein
MAIHVPGGELQLRTVGGGRYRAEGNGAVGGVRRVARRGEREPEALGRVHRDRQTCWIVKEMSLTKLIELN